jgi:hypothetical protein
MKCCFTTQISFTTLLMHEEAYDKATMKKIQVSNGINGFIMVM